MKHAASGASRHSMTLTGCLVFLLLLASFLETSVNAATDPDALDAARKLFYASVTDKHQLQPALQAFIALQREHPHWEGRAMTYTGALVALKGKHSFWPHDKLHWAKRGLQIMDEGIAREPHDIEALFIHSSTCYFLPFFFNRQEDAQEKFRTIIRLLPHHFQAYDRELIRNVVLFIEGKAHLDGDAHLRLEQIKRQLGLASTP